MNQFTISQMQQFSGVKAHTIRIWEKRYNGLTPNRSEGNTRYYSDGQLRRLLNIVSLMNAGYKVSELCRMADPEHFKLLDEGLLKTVSTDNSNEYFINQLISAGVKFDETYFDKVLSNCILRSGLRNTYTGVIYPMLVRVGLLWAKDSIPPAQEHFISNLIRQKIFTALDSLPPTISGRESWLLFLPENELHEVGLLFSHYLIRQAGCPSWYLGSDVPMVSVTGAVNQLKPDNILIFLVSNRDEENAAGYLDQLMPEIKNSRLFVAVPEEMHIRSGNKPGVTIIHSEQALESELKKYLQ